MSSSTAIGSGSQVRGKATYTLAQEIGRGGQGAVFALAGQPNRVAKIYLAPLGEGQVAKLQHLVAKTSRRSPISRRGRRNCSPVRTRAR